MAKTPQTPQNPAQPPSSRAGTGAVPTAPPKPAAPKVSLTNWDYDPGRVVDILFGKGRPGGTGQ